MNWLTKIKEHFKRKIQENEEEAELKKSNFGRDFGWFIELEDKVIGELVNNTYHEMFWVKYEIIAYEGYEEMLFDFDKWAECKFKFRNKHYFQYVDAACAPFIEKEEKNYTIIMRGLYLTCLEKESG